MSGDGIYACDSTYFYTRNNTYRDSLIRNLDYYTLSSRYNPANIYDISRSADMLNSYTSIAGYPYACSVTIPGSNNVRYSVHDFSVPQHLLTRNVSDCLSNALSQNKVMVEQLCVNVYAGQINSYINQIMGMAGWQDSEYLSDSSKELAKDVVQRCTNYSDLLDKYLKNEEKLSPSTINAVLSTLLEKIKVFDEEVKLLDEQLKEEAKTTQQDKANELANDVSNNAGDGSGGGGGGGSSSVSVIEGDSQMNNAQLASRYDIKTPVVTELSTAYAANITNSAGARGTFTTALTALDNKNTAAFLVSLSDKDIEDFCEEIDGQSFASDDDELSMKEFLAKFDGALDLLKSSGFITKKEHEQACRLIADSKQQVKDSFTDSQRSTIVANLKQLKGILSITVDGSAVVKGSQEHFDSLVKTKQVDAEKVAVKEFRKAYALSTQNSETPLTFDENATYGSLPDEITYLPNKDVFQVKIESKTFQGKDFSALNSKIMKCRDENIINSWIEIKKEFLIVQNLAEGQVIVNESTDSEAFDLLSD